MFRPSRVILRPSKKTDRRVVGSVFLEGLRMTLQGRNMSPWQNILFLYINKLCYRLTCCIYGWRVLTARYGLSPYMKQTLLVFKGLNTVQWRISLFCLMYLCVTKFRYFIVCMYVGFKTFYAVRHLDSTASYLPTGLYLGFFRSSPSLYLPSSFSSVFLRRTFCEWRIPMTPAGIERATTRFRTQMLPRSPLSWNTKFNTHFCQLECFKHVWMKEANGKNLA